jgi:hypothetical protein
MLELKVRHGPKKATLDALKESSIWDLGNEVLYRLCESHPAHQSKQEIVAKVWLIGRSYAASIERRKPDGLDTEAFYSEAVVDAMRASSIDSRLAEIDSVRSIQNHADIETALNVHADLTKTFSGASGKANRSLASKYLHFHRPHFFPIYDSRANGKIREIVGGRVSREFPEGDSEYRPFVARSVVLHRWLDEKFGLKLGPRDLDRVLLHY